MMDARFAVKADIPALVELGRSMHVESRYGGMVYGADRAWKRFEDTIDCKDFCVMVVENDDGELAGFLVGSVSEYAFAHDFVANLEFLYLLPARRSGLTAMKMLAAFRRWAKNREFAEIMLCNRFGANESYITKLFAKLGMPVVGGVHAAWVANR